ncbi:MAG: class I SAM-dependent methyltransferase [DPANN group archaeon]|nr:class I SAM-dependent methyltransferase [DPANN group archaeon]
MDKHHHHAGKSSRDILDPERVLQAMGLDKGMSFLDVGAGDGHISLVAARIVDREGDVTAVDVHAPSLALLENEMKDRHISNIDVIEADFTKAMDLKGKRFDRILMANVFHGFVANKELDQVKENCDGLLKRDGLLAIVEFKKDATAGPPREIRISSDRIAALLEPFGFHRIKKEEVGTYHDLTLLKVLEGQ